MARGFARGAPPPPGSFEYLAVGDMWDPEVASRKHGAEPASSSGYQVYEISFTDLDAAQNYVEAVDRAVRQARRVHGDKILSREDELTWEKFFAKWKVFAFDMRGVPGSPSMMLSANKQTFDDLVKEAHRLHDAFARKGASEVPVPYAGELLVLLRNLGSQTLPKKLTAAQMSAKLAAGAKCGERMLDDRAPWWSWAVGRDHLPLKRAVEDATEASHIYGRSRTSAAIYSPGDPAYDEFLRRLTKIWIEAAGLYGIRQTADTARAELKDDVRKMPGQATSYALWLLAVAGVGYLGVSWLGGRSSKVVVAVPDAYPREEE